MSKQTNITCQFCKSEINGEAIVCRHCGATYNDGKNDPIWKGLITGGLLAAAYFMFKADGVFATVGVIGLSVLAVLGIVSLFIPSEGRWERKK